MSAFAPTLSAPVRLAILRCPSCAAPEAVEEAALADAQMIRCRECGETWPARQGRASGEDGCGQGATPVANLPVRRPLVDYAGGDAGSASARIVADWPSAPARRRPWLAALSYLAAILFVAASLAGRQAIVTAVPDLAGLYAAIGLPVHLSGVTIDSVDAERRMEGTGAAIKVRGRLVNMTAEDRKVPPLLLHFRDASGATLHAASADAPVASLAPGKSARSLWR